MIKVNLLKSCVTLFLLSAVVSLLANLLSCSRKSSKLQNREPVVDLLTNIMENSEVPDYVRDNAGHAISHWQNGVIDRKPILVNARLGRPGGCERVILGLMIFDEDRDVCGFVVQEEHAQGRTLEEDYPVYIHCTPSEVLDARWVPIEIRDADQRKDEQLWQEYIEKDFDDLVAEYRKDGKVSPETLQPGRFWEDNLPPIWISVYNTPGFSDQ